MFHLSIARANNHVLWVLLKRLFRVFFKTNIYKK